MNIAFDSDRLIVEMQDGRRILAPLDAFPRPRSATPDELAAWRLIGQGEGIYWPASDEDLSVAGLLGASFS